MNLSPYELDWARKAIKNTVFFKDCGANEIDVLAESLDKVSYSAGAIILFQGEISNKLFIVQTGKVSVLVRKRREMQKIAELGPNGIFGEISLLTPSAATATVRAEEDTDLVALSGVTVQKIVKNDAALAERISKIIDLRLQEQKEPKPFNPAEQSKGEENVPDKDYCNEDDE